MTLFLTGSPTRYGEDHFTSDNGFLSEVKACLPAVSRILLISAAPDDTAFSDSVLSSMTDCIRNSGIRFSEITMLDRRNAAELCSLVAAADFIVLCGGHTPTQNKFINELGLRQILKSYDGVVMGCSAGSMNCADRVYSHPELTGESVDPQYRRWLRGLGLTDINLVPHYYQIKDAVLDGKRLIEDIIIPDSWQHRFITFPDGGYVVCRDGREEVRGTAWEISNGQMRQISAEEKTYSNMNFVFISPHFPQTYCHFCSSLKADGVNVLGIADAPYEELSEELRSSLTEYYKVSNLENYDEVYRAVAYFAFKYGKIDWIESNNEYWLEQDARLRTDFNVTTGMQNDTVASIKNKSEMKKYYALGKVPTARQIKVKEGYEAVKAFVALTGYPIIAKPDNGVGASGTTKMCSDQDLDKWFSEHQSNYGLFVIEEFITGLLVSYDAIYGTKEEPLFESMSVFPKTMLDVVHDNLDNCYYVDKTVPAGLRERGRATVKGFGIKNRFVHMEFFKLDRDREGLGKKGDFVGLEVNCRPAGGYTPDMMNFAHSTDVYRIWADMVAFNERRKDFGEQFYCAYASRRDNSRYVHTHDEVMAKYGSVICMSGRMPYVLSADLGDQFYMARFKTKAEVDDFFAFASGKAK